MSKADQQSELLRLDKVIELLETISRQLCPVCGPELAKSVHPEHDPVAIALERVVSRNGHEHGG